MSDMKRRIDRLEREAGGDGKAEIFVCECRLDDDRATCTCPASKAGDDDVVLRIVHDRQPEPGPVNVQLDRGDNGQESTQ